MRAAALVGNRVNPREIRYTLEGGEMDTGSSGNSNIFGLFTPGKLGEDEWQFDEAYFSDGLVKNHQLLGCPRKIVNG